MTEPRDLPRVSAEEFAEELAKVRGEGHVLIERLLLDLRDASAELDSLRAKLKRIESFCHHRDDDDSSVVELVAGEMQTRENEAETLRARLAGLEENVVAIEGVGVPWDAVNVARWFTGDCVAEKIRRAKVVLNAALRERDEARDGFVIALKTRQEALDGTAVANERRRYAEARVARLLLQWDDTEARAAEAHAVYQAEAHRRGDVRHPDEYVALSEATKEWDRVLVRWIAATTRAALAETVSAAPQEPDLGDVNAYPDRLDEYRNAIQVVQRFQPGGSPPPVGIVDHVWWVMRSQEDRIDAAILERDETREEMSQRLGAAQCRIAGMQERIDELIDPIVRAKMMEPPGPFVLTMDESATMLSQRAEQAEARLARLRERLEGWSQLAHAQPHTTLGECADSLRMTDAALAETVSAAPSIVKLSETHMGEGSPKPPARTPSEIPCMNEQWNGQDISDAMPCDCPQCRIEPPVLPQEPK